MLSPLIKKLTERIHGKSLVPLKERGLCRLLSKPKNMVDDEWHANGRTNLAASKDATSVSLDNIDCHCVFLAIYDFFSVLFH